VTGCGSAIVPPEDTWNSGGFVIPEKAYYRSVSAAAILKIMDRPGLHPGGPLAGRLVQIEPIEERHREGLREAAERDPQIHRYTNMYSLGFDRWFELAVAAENEIPFVVHVDGRPVGSSRYLNIEPFHRRTEIGWTWLERAQWGTGVNIETKYLLLRTRSTGRASCGWSSRPTRGICAFAAPCSASAARSKAFPQAHGAPGLDPRLGVVRDRRRRLASGAVAARGEDRAARVLVRCAVEIAAIRAEPDDAAEQVTQALEGEPLRVEERRDGWVRVVTAYDYPGWIRADALAEGEGRLVADSSGSPIDVARSYLGTRYLWGGMTEHGIDCSGLVHMSYRRVGKLVPRDADQQEDAGVEVGVPESGDLVTYGEEAADHVAFWVGDGRILHSTGREDGIGVVEESEPDELRARRRKLVRL